jgi:hypothetical protein
MPELVDAAKAEFDEPGILALLDEVNQMLSDPSLRYMNVGEVQAELLQRVANRQTVSNRQARNYLYSLRSDTGSKNLQSLRELSATEPEPRRGQGCLQALRRIV